MSPLISVGSNPSPTQAAIYTTNGFLHVKQQNQLFKEVLRSNQDKSVLSSPRPVVADVNFSPSDSSKKFTSKFVEVGIFLPG